MNRTAIDKPLTITIEPPDPEYNRRLALYERNQAWLSEHYQLLGEQQRGKFIAASEGEIFVGDSREEAKRLAQEKHPDDVPYIRYLLKERYKRIYAG